jgi:hypothetical protein
VQQAYLRKRVFRIALEAAGVEFIYGERPGMRLRKGKR